MGSGLDIRRRRSAAVGIGNRRTVGVLFGLLCLLLAGLPASAQGAATSRITGKLTGVSGLRGPARQHLLTVRAVRADTLQVVAGRRLGASGAYALKLPPGIYALVADAGSLRGGPSYSTLSPLIQAKKNRRRRIPLRSRRSRGRSAGAQAVAAAAPKPIAVKHLSIHGWEPFMGKGIADMLITDLSKYPCLDVIEIEKRAEILQEARLQRSPYVDPKTRVPFHPISPKYFVTGSAQLSGGTLTLSVQLVKIRTGKVTARASVSGPVASFFDLEEQLVRQFAPEACGPDLPSAYVGSASGIASGSVTETWTASNLRFEQAGRPDQYRITDGTANWSMTGDNGAGCHISAGPVTFSLGRRDAYDYGPGATFGAIFWNLAADPVAYELGGGWGKQVMATITCPDYTAQYPYQAMPHWLNSGNPEDPTGGANRFRVADPEKPLIGTSTGTWSGFAITWHWNLIPQD